MISNLQLRFGSNPTATPLNFDPGSVTVFVGPNNSGKSLILREIENFLSRESGSNIEGNHIIQGITLEDLSRDDVVDFVRQNNPHIALDNIVANITVAFRGINIFNRDSPVIASHVIRIKDLESENIGQKLDIKRVIAAANTIRLDGSTRLNLTQQAQAGNTDGPPQNPLDKLRRELDAMKKIRDATFDAFERYFVINPRSMTHLVVGMSRRAPSVAEDQSLNDEGKAFYKDVVPIAEFSDGIKAYTGIIAAIFSGKFNLILIDEPEAFLHPPLARKLGSIVGKRATEQKGHVLASTHSSAFLLGCIESGSPVNVVRLTYEQGISGARLLDSTQIQAITRNPLLRSTGVLSALFHRGAIVCEGDRDRVFYEEINYRLINENRGANDVLFINGNGKDSIHNLIKPLREAGIPAAAIVDLDIIDEGDFTALLKAAFVPEDLIALLRNHKKPIMEDFIKSNMKPSNSGISNLSSGARAIAETLLDNAAKYGVFIVPEGAVEQWLAYLGLEVPKNLWLENVFNLLGSDPKSPDYAKPGSDDVWEFIDRIASWLRDSNRRGLPTDKVAQ